MKTFNLIGKILSSSLILIFGIFEITMMSIFSIWKSLKKGYVWFGASYQLFIVLFSFIPISNQIYRIAKSGDSYFFWIIIIIFETLIITFTLNIIIELFFNLINKQTIFDNIQEIQKYSNNYALIIISLLSLLVSYFPNIIPFDNLYLLIIGSIFFVSTVSSDTYRIFIYSKGEVKELSQKVKSTFKCC